MAKRNLLYVKSNATIRHALVHYDINLRKNIVLTEYPKSGGSWICQMISDASGIAFPRNRLPVVRRQLLHGHYRWSPKISNPIVILRDGRDVAVSFYFHSLFVNDKFNERFVQRTKKKLGIKDPENVRENMPRFIEFIFKEKMFPTYSWADFTTEWLDSETPCYKYEEFLESPVSALTRVCTDVVGIELLRDHAERIVEKYSFSNMAKRQPGEENTGSFLRKGIAGDWRNKFTSEAREVFSEFAGDALIRSGYESSNDWVYKEAVAC